MRSWFPDGGRISDELIFVLLWSQRTVTCPVPCHVTGPWPGLGLNHCVGKGGSPQGKCPGVPSRPISASMPYHVECVGVGRGRTAGQLGGGPRTPPPSVVSPY